MKKVNRKQKKKQLKNLVSKGMPTKKIADKLEVSTSTIYNWKLQNGDSERENYKEKTVKFKELYPTHVGSMEELAEKIGVGRTTVFNWQRKYFAVTREQQKKIDFRKLYKSGDYSVKKIAHFMKVHVVTVNRWIREYEAEKTQQKEIDSPNCDS